MTVERSVPEYTIAELEKLRSTEFARLTNDDAVALGLVAVEVIREWKLNLAVEIVVGEDVVFRAKLGTTGAANDPWLVGKAATALHFGEPSLLVRLRHREVRTEFTEHDLDLMKAHGGSIPLRVSGEIVGTITMSGEPDAIDHEAAAEAIVRYLGTI